MGDGIRLMGGVLDTIDIEVEPGAKEVLVITRYEAVAERECVG